MIRSIPNEEPDFEYGEMFSDEARPSGGSGSGGLGTGGGRRSEPVAQRLSVEELLGGLNDEQRTAVVSEAKPLCILAGAGSGKTRVLTRRIAYRVAQQSADPTHTLALTFTRKAADELTKRLRALGMRERVGAGTFHSVAYAQLRQWWADTDQRAPQLTESKIRLVAPILGARRNLVQPVDVVSEIEWAKARLISPEGYEVTVTELGRKPPLGTAEMAELYARYESDKRRKGIVDFDDLLVMCVKAIETDKAFAARQRWRFRHLFVDEFQDVNPAQYRLLQGWLGLNPGGGASSRDPLDLCVVGDPNQAIYAWNGADPTFLTEFKLRFSGAEVVRLEQNYRSTPEILTVADSVLGRGPRDEATLKPNRGSGPIPTISSYASDLEEARAVARSMRDRHSSSTPWMHMAVLTRTNAQGLAFEEAFRAVGIPHRVRGGGSFLNQHVVRETLAWLGTHPDIAFRSRMPDLEEMATTAARSGTTGPEGVNERAAQLEGLIRLGGEFLGMDAQGTTGAFLQWVRGVITSKSDEPTQQANVVEISTFHKSKGLEWPIVFLAGLERGFVPIGQANDQAAWDEERRLLYVAVTRAEKELHCSWSKTRTFGSRTTNRTESPWLKNIEAAQQALANPNQGEWRSLLKASQARLEAAKNAGLPGIRGTRRASISMGTKADPVVFEALKRWRAETARRTGVPAFLICHDTTLAVVAERLPANTTELAGLAGFGQVKVDRYGEHVIAVIRSALDRAS